MVPLEHAKYLRRHSVTLHDLRWSIIQIHSCQYAESSRGRVAQPAERLSKVWCSSTEVSSIPGCGIGVGAIVDEKT